MNKEILISKMVPVLGPMQSPCMIFPGSKDTSGYGRLKHHGIQASAHRLSYELFIGDIPNGMVIDHLCRNPSCIHPWHLEPVTHGENIRRGDHQCRRKTHCKHNHEFTEENTYHYVRSDGGKERYCKKCILIRSAKFAAAKSPIK